MAAVYKARSFVVLHLSDAPAFICQVVSSKETPDGRRSYRLRHVTHARRGIEWFDQRYIVGPMADPRKVAEASDAPRHGSPEFHTLVDEIVDSGFPLDKLVSWVMTGKTTSVAIVALGEKSEPIWKGVISGGKAEARKYVDSLLDDASHGDAHDVRYARWSLAEALVMGGWTKAKLDRPR